MPNQTPSVITHPVAAPTPQSPTVESASYYPPPRLVTTPGDPAPPFVPVAPIPEVPDSYYGSASLYGSETYGLGYAKPGNNPPVPPPITVPTVNGVPQTELPHVPYNQPYLSNAIR
jgi:hypothetical protein